MHNCAQFLGLNLLPEDLFLAISFTLLVALFSYASLSKSAFPVKISLVFVFVGGFGNFVQRFLYGCVSDPLSIFGVSFNYFDLAITTGLVVLFFQVLIKEKDTNEPKL